MAPRLHCLCVDDRDWGQTDLWMGVSGGGIAGISLSPSHPKGDQKEEGPFLDEQQRPDRSFLCLCDFDFGLDCRFQR